MDCVCTGVIREHKWKEVPDRGKIGVMLWRDQKSVVVSEISLKRENWGRYILKRNGQIKLMLVIAFMYNLH